MSEGIILEGGPRDGEQMAIPDDRRWEVRFPETPPLRWDSDSPSVVDFRIHVYARTPFRHRVHPEVALTVFRYEGLS